MKKSLLIATAVLTGSIGFGQELTSKKGFPILPETGDYSIGIDATPFLQYFGQIFSNGRCHCANMEFPQFYSNNYREENDRRKNGVSRYSPYRY